nr:hypothetical protein [Tanacetum cinerariifolium]
MMADVNVNAPAGEAPTMAPPIRTDDQILPHIRWVPIAKSNCYLNVEKSQSNPIYKIAMDILKHTNFFRAFIASSTIPSIYIQQLWDTGIVTRAHIDYAERIWEEFSRSIHTFIDDKRNLAQHTHKKKKATLIVIPSIQFTKLIIYHLQMKHKFHPRPDSPLHSPNEEPVLGYLKFSAKGTKRGVFRMPIPGSDSDSPAPKPTKLARKPKSMAPKAYPRPSISKPVTSVQPEPKSTLAKTQGKKRKPTIKMSNKPSIAIKTRRGLVTKKRKPISSLRFEDGSVDEDVPSKEPHVMLKREPEPNKYQMLSEVPGKGKAKVTEEQVSHDLLNLQKPKLISPADQYIFQRHTSTPIGSSKHDESSSLYAKLRLTKNKEEIKEDVPGADKGGQAGPDPGNAKESQPMPSYVVHAGSDREHIDLDVADVLPQPPPEEMDEGFTATAYPKVQENLKLTVEEQVLLEEPASSLGTLYSLQHLTKDLSFGDLFFNDKPLEADNDKVTAKIEAESMVLVMIQQDMSSIPPMTTPTIDLTLRPESLKVHQQLNAIATETTTTITTTLLPPPYQQQSTIEAMIMKHIGELEHIVANLIQENKRLEQRDLPVADMKEILHQRMWETDFYKSHEDHMQLYEALVKSMNYDHSKELAKDLAEVRPSRASGSLGAFGSSQVPPPPPPPPSTNEKGQSKGSATPSSSKTAASAEYQAWTTTDMRLKPSISLTPVDLQMDKDMAPDEQARSLNDEDIGSAHIPKTKAAYYPKVGLEQMVPHQMWIDEECKYDIDAMYGISHWWFQRQRFYIDRHTSEGDRRAVKTHMRILSVVRIEVFSMYGYDYMKKIVLLPADLNEHVMAERDLKYLYLSDFEDMYSLNLQGHLNHLPRKDKKILTTAVNLWTRHLVIRHRVEDFHLEIESYQTQLNLTKP